MIYSGMRIIEDDTAYTLVRKRPYAKRRARSPRHWARIDKKWRKRFGFHVKPEAYMLGDDTLIVHPLLAAQYRRAFNEAMDLASFQSAPYILGGRL